MISKQRNLAQTTPESTSTRTLQLASYNIHRCVGSDGRRDPARVREVLRALDADLIALQEVELLRDDPGLLDYLCADSAWQPVFGVTVQHENGDYGNAVLCRLPVDSVHQQDLSFPQREPRGAMHLRCTVGSLQLQVTATHFGLRAGERRMQAKALVDELDAASRAANAPDAGVLMGDFNEWAPRSRTLRYLGRRFLSTPAPRTFPTRQPLFALDRIWVTPGIESFELEAVRTPLTRIASDHLPLRARLRLR